MYILSPLGGRRCCRGWVVAPSAGRCVGAMMVGAHNPYTRNFDCYNVFFLDLVDDWLRHLGAEYGELVNRDAPVKVCAAVEREAKLEHRWRRVKASTCSGHQGKDLRATGSSCNVCPDLVHDTTERTCVSLTSLG